MVTVKDVERGSYASKAKLMSGDVLVSVNGNEISFVIPKLECHTSVVMEYKG